MHKLRKIIGIMLCIVLVISGGIIPGIKDGSHNKAYAYHEEWYVHEGWGGSQEFAKVSMRQEGKLVKVEIRAYTASSNWGPNKHHMVEHNNFELGSVTYSPYSQIRLKSLHQTGSGTTWTSWEWVGEIDPRNGVPSSVSVTIPIKYQVSSWSQSGGGWQWNGAHWATMTKSVSLDISPSQIPGIDIDEYYYEQGVNNKIKTDTSTRVYVGGNYSKQAPDIEDYEYLGYNHTSYLDPPKDTSRNVSLSNVAHRQKVYFLYKSKYVKHNIKYDANGGANPPVDPKRYKEGEIAIVMNKGYMSNPGVHFYGWTLDRENTGKVYMPGEHYKMGTEDVTFYAKWGEPPLPPNTGRMEMKKTSDLDEVGAGEIVEYILTIKNTGTKNLNNVVVNDYMNGIPNENFLSFELDSSSTVAGGTNVVTENNRKATIKVFRQGEIAKFTYKVKIPENSPVGKIWDNNAFARADDGTNVNATHKVKTKEKSKTPNVEVDKTSNKSVALPGEKVRYTVVVKNISGKVLNDVKVEDSMPGVELKQKEPATNTTVTQDGAPNKVKIGSLNIGETIVFEYIYTIPTSAVPGSEIKNTAKVTDNENRIYLKDNKVRVEKPEGKLDVYKTSDRILIEPGGIATYRLVITNIGTKELNNIVVTDHMAGIPKANFLTFELDSGSTGDVGDNVVIEGKRKATIKKLSIGKNIKFKYTVKIPDNAVVGEVWENMAIAKADDGTTGVANHTVVTKHKKPNIDVSKDVDESNAKPGDTVNYTIVVKNISGKVLNNVKVEDSLPGITLNQDPVTNTTVIPNPLGKGVIIGTLKIDEIVIFKYSYKIPESAVVGSKVKNIAKITDEEGKIYIDDNDVDVKPHEKKLEVVKTSDQSAVVAGEVVTYRLSIRNVGTKDLSNIEVEDTMTGVPDSNFISFELDPSVVIEGRDNVVIRDKRSANIALLKSGKEVKFIYKVKIPVTSTVGDIWENKASAKAADGTEASDKNKVIVKEKRPNVEPDKKADKNNAAPGEKVTYTVTVKNISGKVLNNVKVEDSLPGIILKQKEPATNNTVVQDGAPNKVKIGKLDIGETVVFIYEYTLPETLTPGTVLNNKVKITDHENKVYITDEDVVVVPHKGKLEVKKTSDTNTPKKGDVVIYNLSIKNMSEKDLSDVNVSDFMADVPSANFLGLEFDTSSTVPGGNNIVISSNNKAVIKLLKKGQEAKFICKVKMPDTVENGDKLENVLLATSSDGTTGMAKHTVEIKGSPSGGGGIVPPPTPTPDPKPDPKPEPKPDKPTGGSLLDKMKQQEHFAYMTGYPDRTFKPDGKMTRDEVTVMFARLLTGKMVLDRSYDSGFYDVKLGKWSKDQIGFMREKGIIKGYPDGTFRPDNPITRAEFATMASRFDNLAEVNQAKFSDVPDDYWASKSINSAALKGWIKGYPDGTFKPDRMITRAEVVAITNRMLDRIADKKYIDEHTAQIKYYKDLNPHYWAYYTIHEASNGHDYKRNADGGETWLRLWDLFIPNPTQR